MDVVINKKLVFVYKSFFFVYKIFNTKTTSNIYYKNYQLHLLQKLLIIFTIKPSHYFCKFKIRELHKCTYKSKKYSMFFQIFSFFFVIKFLIQKLAIIFFTKTTHYTYNKA